MHGRVIVDNMYEFKQNVNVKIKHVKTCFKVKHVNMQNMRKCKIKQMSKNENI